jgi:hypothetical protein
VGGIKNTIVNRHAINCVKVTVVIRQEVRI